MSDFAGIALRGQPPYFVRYRKNDSKSAMRQFDAIFKRVPVFEQGAVCLTKFGPESGETADEILARKELERRSGIGVHKNEFWWGIGEKGTAQSIIGLVSQHGAQVILFSAIKNQALWNGDPASNLLVWRKYRTLGSSESHDIPKHVLITSAVLTKSGTHRTTHFALICKSRVPIKMGAYVFRFSNPYYKNLGKDGKLGKSARGQRTTTALVRWRTSPISGAECDSLIDFSADFCPPHCVELSDPRPIPRSAIATLNQQIANGLGIRQWVPAVTAIRQ
jgi:hypothetical protein